MNIRKMKRLAGVALSALIFLCACDQSMSIRELDVKPYVVSSEQGALSVSIERSLFSSKDEVLKEKCDLFNRVVEHYIAHMADSIRMKTDIMAGHLSVGAGRKAPVCELHISDSVFSANERYVSIRLKVYAYMGGAHGMTSFRAFNYDMSTGKFLADTEIVSPGETIDAKIAAAFINRDSCFTATPSLETAGAVNFTREALLFTYPQYVLGSYSCGWAEVALSRADCGECLLIE